MVRKTNKNLWGLRGFPHCYCLTLLSDFPLICSQRYNLKMLIFERHALKNVAPLGTSILVRDLNWVPALFVSSALNILKGTVCHWKSPRPCREMADSPTGKGSPLELEAHPYATVRKGSKKWWATLLRCKQQPEGDLLTQTEYDSSAPVQGWRKSQWGIH